MAIEVNERFISLVVLQLLSWIYQLLFTVTLTTALLDGLPVRGDRLLVFPILSQEM